LSRSAHLMRSDQQQRKHANSKAAARSSERHNGALALSNKPETNEKRHEHLVGFSARCQVHAETGRKSRTTPCCDSFARHAQRELGGAFLGWSLS
jgi:hypothetical protein